MDFLVVTYGMDCGLSLKPLSNARRWVRYPLLSCMV